MIKNFQLLIHQVSDNVELNEKVFRDLGSRFDGLLAQMVERMTLNH